MEKFYYLSTCQTCQRILKALDPGHRVPRQDIKSEPITADQLEELYRKAGSYEALFNRRSRQYRARHLHQARLTEKNYRDLMLEEYTFLKRPVLVKGDKVFIGNSKKTVEAARAALSH